MRKRPQCNVICLDEYQKKKNEKMQDYKQHLIIAAACEIMKNLPKLIDNSNTDYAVGHLLETAEFIGKLYSIPGYAAEQIRTGGNLAKERLARVEVMKKRVKSAYGE